ncbi:hypothetical protein FB45DRAFT_1105728 [Roridomyces roridus]|uniref:Uncharacterized protein n=1 Tax=Roridomyces roridus TaxID=1738132 RepID=A0AAD7BCB8_9AGAR|nr:hypothetical protein FB45DRAFT_1105728 [Roridomyces roridus]
MRCPGLTHVDVLASQDMMESLQNLHNFILGFDRLRSVSVPRIDSRALEHICRLPTLTSLSLTSYTGVTLPTISSDELPFPALHTLSIVAQNPDKVPLILSLLARAPLQSLKIDFGMSRDTAQLFPRLCKSLGENCTSAHASLQSLSLGVRYRRSLEPGLTIQCIHLRPLFLFTELTEVSLHPHHGFDLNNSAVDELARAWPRVNKVVLARNRRIATVSRVTLAGLLSFAQHCPYLSELQISFNASVVPKTQTRKPGVMRVQQTSLKSLGVQTSPCRDHQATAAFLSSAFPRLRKLNADAIDPEDDVVAESLIKKWRAVEELLPLLSKVRAEERIWTKPLKKKD